MDCASFCAGCNQPFKAIINFLLPTSVNVCVFFYGLHCIISMELVCDGYSVQVLLSVHLYESNL